MLLVDRDPDRRGLPDPVINVYLESFAFGRFSIGYGFIGPTEVRIVLVVLNTLFALGAGIGFRIADLDLTVFDVIGLAVAAAMVVLLVSRAAKNLRRLGQMEPPAARRSRASRARQPDKLPQRCRRSDRVGYGP